MNKINQSEDVFSLLTPFVRMDIEELWTVALDSQLNVLACEMIFRGTNNACLVHPRDIFRFCLKHNAVQFIIAHSHPSQSFEPSNSDLAFTKKLLDLSHMLEIPLVDHLILTNRHFYSFADQGIIKKICAKKIYQKFYIEKD